MFVMLYPPVPKLQRDVDNLPACFNLSGIDLRVLLCLQSMGLRFRRVPEEAGSGRPVK